MLLFSYVAPTQVSLVGPRGVLTVVRKFEVGFEMKDHTHKIEIKQK
jgi:hypothetical protein